MPLLTTLASLSQTPASNAADGSVDAPSTMDNQVNLLASFIAQIRDGSGFTTGTGNVGQCLLSKSGTNLLLFPFKGNGLTINGTVQKIPSVGVTLAPTALSVGTTYYIYAYMVSTVMTLEAVTTGHSTDANTGIEIKTGDVSRTLVGMARPNAGPAWQDTPSQRFVVSWFNRKALTGFNALASGVTIISATATLPSYAEVSNLFRMEFLIWGGDSCQYSASGFFNVNAAAGAASYASLGIDSISPQDIQTICQPSTANFNSNLAMSGSNSGLAEGYHFVTLLGSNGQAGTSTTFTGGSTAQRCVVNCSFSG